MRFLSFELSMPGSPSWNGRWSGEGRCYAKVRSVSASCDGRHLPKKGEVKDFGYSWDDGWYANVSVRQVDSKEAAKIRKKSVGFAGYDWMIDSILIDGTIQTPKDRRS